VQVRGLLFCSVETAELAGCRSCWKKYREKSPGSGLSGDEVQSSRAGIRGLPFFDVKAAG